MWVGVFYYVVDEYEWYLFYSERGLSICVYDLLLDLVCDKVWMKKGSFVYDVLRKIIFDK